MHVLDLHPCEGTLEARSQRAHQLNAYVSIRQHTPAYVSKRQHTPAYQHMPYVSNTLSAKTRRIRQHTSAYISIRQHTPACAIRQ